MVSSKNSRYSRIWYDDYLDLYNIAVQMQDQEWQAQLLQTLKQGEAHIKRDERFFGQLELWRKYDRLNSQLLEMIRQLRLTANPDESQEIQKRMWEIKNERIEIGKKIQLLGG